MGMCGEDTAEKHSISREEQDTYARRCVCIILCVLERALPTELLRQLSWLGRITHTQSKTEHSVF